MYAQNLPLTTRQFEIDLLRDGLDTSRLAVLTGPEKLKVWVSGSEQQLRELRDAEKFGMVDLTRAQPGERLYPVALQPTLLRELAHDSVPEVRLAIESILRRTVRVTPQATGRLPGNDLRLDRLVIDPETVSVSGPESRVREVAEVRVPFDLAAADPKRAAPHMRPVELVDSKGRRMADVNISPAFVAVTPVMVPAPEEKTASVLVRFRGKLAAGYEQTAYTIDHESVVLVGPSFALATVSAVETEAIDVSGLSAPRQFVAKLRMPTGVTATRPSEVRVRVIVRRAPKLPPGSPAPSPAPGGADSTSGVPATTGTTG